MMSAVPPPRCRDLFRQFLLLGLTGFGGVLAMSRDMLVERTGWLTTEEFAELLGLAQILPGGNAINLAVAVGQRYRGARGAVAALCGLIAAPSAIVIALGAIYARFQNEPHLRHLFAGLAAAGAGLLIAMAVKVALPLRGNVPGMSIAGLCIVAMAILRLPLLPIILVLAPLSILVTALFAR
jgi:chromate transporter